MLKKFHESIDKRVFYIGGLICLITLLFTVAVPQRAEAAFSWLLSVFCTDFGWFYQLSVVIFILFAVYLAMSKYGKIKLGKDDDKPEHSTISWFFMLFASGMGIGLVFWSVAEPLSHYITPPYGDGSTAESAVLAMQYTFMHWGIHPWACYVIVGLPLAYFQFRKGQPALMSSCVAPVIGEKRAAGIIGCLIDILAIFATVFGVATSLGLGAMQINSGLFYVFNIPYGIPVLFAIITIATILFISSSVSGINRGMKLLSDINMAIFFILMAFIFFTGSMLFTMNFMMESFGAYISNIVTASFWTDTFGQSDGWLSGWTIFYWAWWISWGPFVGGFIARISKGRTIRELVAGAMLVPMLLSVLFMTIMGGNAIHLDMNGVSEIAAAMNENVSYALFALLEQFPLAKITSLAAVILLCVFFITSAQSSTFVCAMMTSKGSQNPPNSLRIFWGVVEGVSAAALLYVGGLTALQSAAIVSALPMIFVCFLMAAALLKCLRKEIQE